MKVRLEKYEMIMAAYVGLRRHIEKFDSKLKNNHGNPRFGWHTNVEGACAELAVAKHFGVYWDGSVNTYKAPDVCGWQVRHTELDDGSLIVRDDDANDQAFVLVTGQAPEYELRGWLYGREAKRAEWHYRSGTPCWMVPQKSLSSIELLAELCRAHYVVPRASSV